MLITAGPTHEPLDAVRYVANRSSGRMGIALAEAARDAGWSVTLLLGPIAAEPPADMQTASFETAADLAKLLDEHFPACDVLIMAAAVADYRPSQTSAAKLPRQDRPLVLELEPTPDLVAACAARKRPDQRIIGFALEEPAVLERRALDKLRRKGLDAIVANPLDTMGSADVAATIYAATEEPAEASAHSASTINAPKPDFARRLITWIDAHWPGGEKGDREKGDKSIRG
jgi:phosphopantothenoylcysteine decarboxylase/phosphopantothenate--cysteine ligase